MAIPDAALAAAASALGGAPGSEEGRELLDFLGWAAPAPAADAAERARLLRAARLCRRVFALAAPDSPGLLAFGAELDLAVFAGEPGLAVIGSAGVAGTPGEAFAACIGEAMEIAAQVETPAMRAAPDPEAPLPARLWPGGGTRPVPRDLCLRRAPARVLTPPPAPLSIGCAAGRSAAEARLRALLELVERDAVALWWGGGRPPRPPALEDQAASAALLAALRKGRTGRRTWLLDITTDLGVPAFAAVSFGAGGQGFCCGTAARTRPGEAARAALLELCQNELALHVVRRKAAEGGEAALGARDRAMRERHARVGTGPDWLLHPAGAPLEATALPAEPEAAFAAIGARLAAHGFDLLLVEHGGAEGIPVWRVLCPGLACAPSEETPPRLAAAIAAHGGGPGNRFGVSLFG